MLFSKNIIVYCLFMLVRNRNALNNVNKLTKITKNELLNYYLNYNSTHKVA